MPVETKRARSGQPKTIRDNTWTMAPKRALAVAVQLPDQDDVEVAASFVEITRLAATLGIEVTATVAQKRESAGSHYLGDGKLLELKSMLGAVDNSPIEMVIVDGELTPGQQRAMTRALEVTVLDRTAMILRIFEQRAQTPRAKIEVEIARLMYELPRLRDDESLRDKQGGGAGRGERGHTSVELAKQQARQRLSKLRWSLNELQRSADHKRNGARRDDSARVALVGYTNAGKSSLMRALTDSQVLVEDKLFATLSTTTRPLRSESPPRVLITDTVGFIRRLPHDLVASFRSTLDEARDADRLLLVVDAADPAWRAQLQVTRDTLSAIGAHKPQLLVLNKVDRLPMAERLALAAEHPEAVQVCAHSRADVGRLRAAILQAIDRTMTEAVLEVPFTQSAFAIEIRRHARVIQEQYTETGTVLRVRARQDTITRWRASLM